MDRVSRSVQELSRLATKFVIRTVRTPVNFDVADGRFLLHQQAALAQYESDKNSERTKRAMVKESSDFRDLFEQYMETFQSSILCLALLQKEWLLATIKLLKVGTKWRKDVKN